MRLSLIFKNKPNRGWGSRGNPYFWNHLCQDAENVPMPISEDELVAWIKDEHLKLTGKELTPESDVYVEKYDHGGMSGGRITGEWWFEIGIPLLIKRAK